MISIKKTALKAAMICTAIKDLRYYLNCVLFRVTESGGIYLSATDGHRLFLGKVEPLWTDTPQQGPFDILIPSDAVKTALQGCGKYPHIKLASSPDGRYILGDTLFTPVDGKFPDISRVIPTETSGVAGEFNWEYVSDAQKCLRLWDDHKNNLYSLKLSGESSAYMATEGAFVVIMPVHSGKVIQETTFKPI